MKNEKRRHERFPISQDIMISLGQGPEIKTSGINISESGLLCFAEKEINTGMLVSFKLTIPSDKSSLTVPCEGIVLKCDKVDGGFNIIIDFTDQECL